MGARDIRAGRAFVELYIKRSAFMQGLAGAQQRLRDFGQAVSMIGRRMVMVAAVASAPFAIATRTFASFEDQMLAVQAVTGATTEKFGVLYDLAKELGRTTSFTASEVGGGMVSLGRSGFRPEEIEAATGSMLNLARATGTELARSADIASGTLRAFNLEAGQMTRVADVMTATANNSAQTLEDLGESMKYVAPVANAAGESLEDTCKVLGILANMQIKGSMAGTGYRKMLLSLADPAIQKKLAGLGVAVKDPAGNLRPIAGILREIGGAMKTMGSGDRLALAKDLFGARAATAGVVLGRAIDQYDDLEKAIDNAGGTAKKTAGIMDSGLGGALRILWSAVEGVQIAIGEALSEAFSDLASAAVPVLNLLAEIIKQHKDIVVRIVAVIAGVGAAGVALMGFGMMLQIAAFGLAALHGTIMAVAGVIGVVFTTAISPAVLLTAAIAGLAAGFVYLVRNTAAMKSVGEWLLGLFDGIRSGIGTVAEDVSSAWQGISDALAAGDIEAAVAVVVSTAKLEWTRLTTWLTETWEGFKIYWSGLTSWLAEIMVMCTGGIKETWVELVGYLTKVWERWKVSTFEEGLASLLAPIFAKLEGVSVEETRKVLKEDFARGRKALPERLAAIDAETEAKKGKVRAETQQQMDILKADKKRSDAAGMAKITAAQQEVDDAKKARDEALAAARMAKIGADIGAGAGGPGKPSLPGMPDIAAVSAAVSRGASMIRGTFSASAARGFGMGKSHEEKMVALAEAAAKREERIAKSNEIIARYMSKLSLEASP